MDLFQRKDAKGLERRKGESNSSSASLRSSSLPCLEEPDSDKPRSSLRLCVECLGAFALNVVDSAVMRTTFTVRNKKYELSLEKREPGEGEKNHPFTATVSGQNGPVRGTLQFTQGALDAAQKMAAAKWSLGRRPAGRCGRPIAGSRGPGAEAEAGLLLHR